MTLLCWYAPRPTAAIPAVKVGREAQPWARSAVLGRGGGPWANPHERFVTGRSGASASPKGVRRNGGERHGAEAVQPNLPGGAVLRPIRSFQHVGLGIEVVGHAAVFLRLKGEDGNTIQR